LGWALIEGRERDEQNSFGDFVASGPDWVLAEFEPTQGTFEAS